MGHQSLHTSYDLTADKLSIAEACAGVHVICTKCQAQLHVMSPSSASSSTCSLDSSSDPFQVHIQKQRAALLYQVILCQCKWTLNSLKPACYRLPASAALELPLKYQIPGHSMEELISLRSNEDLDEFKVTLLCLSCLHRHSFPILTPAACFLFCMFISAACSFLLQCAIRCCSAAQITASKDTCNGLSLPASPT